MSAPLPVYNASQLAQLLASRPATTPAAAAPSLPFPDAVAAVVKEAHSVILAAVEAGQTSVEIHHEFLRGDYEADVSFGPAVVSGIRSCFPNTTVQYVPDDGTGSMPHIRFSFSP
jgi:hypothetical protein